VKNVEKWSLGYELLRPIAQIEHLFTHRTVVVNGAENVPMNEALILAPNHQNAMMDSIGILCNVRLQPVFLGRADMFNNKLFAAVLHFFKIIPVYRIRDGKDQLDKNQEVFENCVSILKQKKKIIIYPEAAHTGYRSMLPHKKAIPRIVFMAAEETNFNLDVKIVPVGLTFSHYYNFRRDFSVTFGKPISTSEFFEEYKQQGETRATASLRKRIHDEIDKMIINVPDKTHYDLYHQSLEIYTPQLYKKLSVQNHFKNFVKAGQFLNKEIHSALNEEPEKLEHLAETATKYKKLKTKYNFSEKVIQKGKIGFAEQLGILLLALLALPFSIPGALAHGWLFWLTRYPMRKNIKDKQLYGTVSFGISFVAYPIWLIILFFVMWAILNNWIIALIVVVLSLPSGLLAWETGQLLTRLVQRRKISNGFKARNKSIIQLYESRKEIISFLDKIIK